ncbi:Origin of replication complex subunit 4 [Glycine max]|nr:Origin of replication complex subunit 4 [Glycine max]
MEQENHKIKAVSLLRSRICDPKFIFISESPESNYSKLKFMISSSVTEACNNSILLLGPRGSGKNAVLELVIQDLLQEYPDSVSVIRLNGLLHSDDISAFKASFDDNSQFMVAILKECGLAHKTVIFVLDEFHLFAQGKQRLLYSLLDAMQSITSQAVVLGISCRLDADQLLEKRVRSRFSHRKLLFLPPSIEDSQKLLMHILTLPIDSSFPHAYAVEFNRKNIIEDRRFKETLNKYLNVDSSVKHLLRFLFCAVSHMDLQTGFLSRENFEIAFTSIQRQPKLECLRNCSILELQILVCMKRLEVKEQSLCNFNSVMKEYISTLTSERYARHVCLRVCSSALVVSEAKRAIYNNRGQSLSVEFRPVKLLISSAELHQGLRANTSCPFSLYLTSSIHPLHVISVEPKLLKLMDREG